MTPCSWCALEFPTKPGKHFCCAAHRMAYHSACRKFTADMLRQGFITREALVQRYGRTPCTAATADPAIDMRDKLGNHTRALEAAETRMG